jgi:hypothetical protein
MREGESRKHVLKESLGGLVRYLWKLGSKNIGWALEGVFHDFLDRDFSHLGPSIFGLVV